MLPAFISGARRHRLGRSAAGAALPRAVAFGVGLLLLAGCQAGRMQTPPMAGVAPPPAVVVSPQDQPLQQVIAGSPAAGETVLADGSRVQLGEVYAAASGRNCRSLTVVSPSGIAESRTACQGSAGWQIQRPVRGADGLLRSPT